MIFLVLWLDSNGNKQYEWISNSTNDLFVLDVVKKSKIYFASTKEQIILLDKILLNWLYSE